MENTIKQKIIKACCDNSLLEFRGFKTTVIKGDNNIYEIKANTILEIEYRTMTIYSTAAFNVPHHINILGYCDDLSFLDSL
jgi:hypothetical protein